MANIAAGGPSRFHARHLRSERALVFGSGPRAAHHGSDQVAEIMSDRNTRLTRGFLEYARHRGFITDPPRVRHPRDKPRVERSVPYVRFFKGAEFRDLTDMRSCESPGSIDQQTARSPGSMCHFAKVIEPPLRGV